MNNLEMNSSRMNDPKMNCSRMKDYYFTYPSNAGFIRKHYIFTIHKIIRNAGIIIIVGII